MTYAVFKFVVMFVFKTQSQANTEEINNYEEFLNSNCELALFIYDNMNVENYCKNQATIEEIKHNLNNSYSCVKYITTSNDVRTKFNVF